MRVLVLGGGGREHALCWALARSPGHPEILCAPGNPGIASVARLREVDPADPRTVTALAIEEGVDLVVVGPEAPLVAGVGDALRAAGVPVFGPDRAAARIEGSKAFAKQVMAAAGVPTAEYWTGDDPAEAKAALDRFPAPYVVKADGLAAGKGVAICADRGEAERAIDAAMIDRAFGDAGARIVVEEHLEGPEVSVFGVCDGASVVTLPVAQDFKRARDGDAGPNTGGMGAYSPVPAIGEEEAARIGTETLAPVVATLAERGVPYVGVLYAGLMLTADGPKVLEFNARFGDPEAQAILPRLRGGLSDLLAAGARGSLGEFGGIDWDHRACVTVVLASGGYPGPYEHGKPIAGLEAADGVPDAVVFHAGTALEDDRVVTAGGRVLAVSGLGETLALARAAAYRTADLVSFDGLHRREDIGAHPTT